MMLEFGTVSRVSSGEEDGSVNVLPWQQKSCRKDQQVLWRLDEGHLLDQSGLALTVDYDNLAGRNLLRSCLIEI